MKHIVETKFWEFDQNNSGGRFDIRDDAGIGPRVWIEATSRDDAVARALAIGLYFDGVSNGVDCECCGDRWHEPWRDEGRESPEIKKQWDFNWHDTVYVHHYDGSIERVKVSALSSHLDKP